MFNIFANRAGVPNLLRGNAWVYVNNDSYLKLWVKNGTKFDQQNSILKQVPNKLNWWRQYKLPMGKNYKDLSSTVILEPTNTYVDNTYNLQTHSITGQVYENVSENDFNDQKALKLKATKYSIWDAYDNKTKYYLAKNNQNATLESYDNGATWHNFQLIDGQIGNNPIRNEAFSGNAVGSGIQLKYQKNPKLNNRIIFAMYNYTAGIQSPYYIYSDDFGKTWNKKINFGFKRNLIESSFIETEDGELYWYLRQAVWGSKNNRPAITKSLDGGLTWINLDSKNKNQNWKDLNLKVDGNVFSGLAYFKIKNKKYFVFALPKVNFRKAGSLYVADEKFEKITEVYTFDPSNYEHFVYSYPITINIGKNFADILIAYEASNKTKVANYDKHFNNRPKGDGIQLDKIRITIK